MQTTIGDILKQTVDFPYSNFHYHDGTVISEVNKSKIDNCLQCDPQMLYLHPFRYASATVEVYGSGMVAYFRYKAVTSVIAYLLELGGGIGIEQPFDVIHLKDLPVQLFVGASDSFKKGSFNSNMHIYSYTDIVSKYTDNKLTDDDVQRLSRQALHGLHYGNFNPTIKLELAKIYYLLAHTDFISSLTGTQLTAYLSNLTEMQTVLLQVMHQHAFPPEIFYIILTQLTGLKESKTAHLNNKIITHYEDELPGFKMRRSLG